MKGVLAGGQAAGSVGGVLPMGGGGEGLNPFSCYAPRGTGGTGSSMLQHSMADQFTLSQVRFFFIIYYVRRIGGRKIINNCFILRALYCNILMTRFHRIKLFEF
jgi:hypothetical protein